MQPPSLQEEVQHTDQILLNKGAPQIIPGVDPRMDDAPGTVRLEELQPPPAAGGPLTTSEQSAEQTTEHSAELGADPDGAGTTAPSEPSEADVRFTEAVRAELARNAMGAPEDVAAPLAASVLQECKWRQAILRARHDMCMAQAATRHASHTRLLHNVQRQVQINLTAAQSALKARWAAVRGPLARRLRGAGPATGPLLQQIGTASSVDTICDALGQVLQAQPRLAVRLPGLQVAHLQALQLGHLETQLEDVGIDLALEEHAHRLREGQLQEQFKTKSADAVAKCRLRLEELGNQMVPAKGLHHIAPPPAKAPADAPPVAPGGRLRATNAAAAVQATATAAVLVQQREAARRALQARVLYEMHMLEKNVSEM